MIDNYGNQVIPGSLDNGATDVEYSPAIERKICAADERFDSVNEAIGTLQYNLEQHIAQCADGLAPLADFIASSWAVLDEYEARLAKLEAEARPMMDENGVLVSHDAWDELEALRRFEALVPWEEIGHCLSVAIYGAPLQRENAQAALNWWHANAPKEAGE